MAAVPSDDEQITTQEEYEKSATYVHRAKTMDAGSLEDATWQVEADVVGRAVGSPGPMAWKIGNPVLTAAIAAIAAYRSDVDNGRRHKTMPSHTSPIGTLWAACQDGNIAAAKWITNTFQLDSDDIISFNNRALCNCCKSGNVELLKWFVEQFSLRSLDGRDGENEPLFLCCRGGHIECAQFLVRRFALTIDDVRARGTDVLRACVEGGHTDLAKWLVNHFGLYREDEMRMSGV